MNIDLATAPADSSGTFMVHSARRALCDHEGGECWHVRPRMIYVPATKRASGDNNAQTLYVDLTTDLCLWGGSRRDTPRSRSNCLCARVGREKYTRVSPPTREASVPAVSQPFLGEVAQGRHAFSTLKVPLPGRKWHRGLR